MSLGTLGKYELLEKIAEGGMGELFRARSLGPGGFERIVALKRIRPSMLQDSRSRQMFIEEAKIASFVSHPNLVTLFEFEEEGDLLYLVMELVEGRDLAKILARCRQLRDPLRIRLAVRIAEQVAAGLDYLHRLGQKGEPLQVVHRDVSPQNVLVSFDGVVKLTDFGIAYMRRSEPVTQAGILKGKMGYLTPEQLSEARIDGRADIFCLGIVLWEMLTGARLFQGTSDAAVLEQVLHKRIPIPSTLNEDVPAGLDQVVMRALQRDRNRRFERAGEMAAALHALEGWVATDLELGQELHRYFPEHTDHDRMLPSPGPVEPRTESVSTAVDRPQPGPPEVVSESALAPTAPSSEPLLVITAPPIPASADEPVPRQPPPPPPVTLPTAKPSKPARSNRSIVLLAAALVLMAGVGFWQARVVSARRAASSGASEPAAVVDVPPEQPEPEPMTPVPSPVPSPDAPPAMPTADATASAGSEPPHRVGAAHGGTVVRAMNVAPWAEVVMDGVSLGYTARVWKVASGHHHLLLRNVKAGIEREFDLDFPPGGEVVLRGKLRSLQPELVR